MTPQFIYRLVTDRIKASQYMYIRRSLRSLGGYNNEIRDGNHVKGVLTKCCRDRRTENDCRTRIHVGKTSSSALTITSKRQVRSPCNLVLIIILLTEVVWSFNRAWASHVGTRANISSLVSHSLLRKGQYNVVVFTIDHHRLSWPLEAGYILRRYGHKRLPTLLILS